MPDFLDFILSPRKAISDAQKQAPMNFLGLTMHTDEEKNAADHLLPSRGKKTPSVGRTEQEAAEAGFRRGMGASVGWQNEPITFGQSMAQGRAMSDEYVNAFRTQSAEQEKAALDKEYKKSLIGGSQAQIKNLTETSEAKKAIAEFIETTIPLWNELSPEQQAHAKAKIAAHSPDAYKLLFPEDKKENLPTGYQRDSKGGITHIPGFLEGEAARARATHVASDKDPMTNLSPNLFFNPSTKRAEPIPGAEEAVGKLSGSKALPIEVIKSLLDPIPTVVNGVPTYASRGSVMGYSPEQIRQLRELAGFPAPTPAAPTPAAPTPAAPTPAAPTPAAPTPAAPTPAAPTPAAPTPAAPTPAAPTPAAPTPAAPTPAAPTPAAPTPAAAPVQRTHTPSQLKLEEGHAALALDQEKEVVKSGFAALQRRDSLDNMKEATKGLDGNLTSEILLQISRGFSAAGIEIDTSKGLKEYVQSATKKFALEMREADGKNLMPGPMSNFETELLLNMSPNLTNSAQGVRFLIGAMKEANNRQIVISKMAQARIKARGSLMGEWNGTTFNEDVATYYQTHPLTFLRTEKERQDKLRGARR